MINLLNFAKSLQPIYRSLTGVGNLETLKLIKSRSSQKFKIKNFNSREKVFDWHVPDEWIIKDAYILTPSKKKICNFKKNFLHLVGYSQKISKYMEFSELKKKMYYSKSQKTAIPYVTSYYKKDWGFCISYNEFKKLKNGKYKVYIDSYFKKGKMSYGEFYLKGKSKKEIFFSTYICHPFMANNEISGPTVMTFIMEWLEKNYKKLNYSYRIIFIPETIGSIAYINKNLNNLKKNILAGFNITCVGDERSFSMIPSKNDNTYSDKILKFVLNSETSNFIKYNWNDRGSDERQYCSPGVDLPIATFCRSKFGTYPEYHTSNDTFGKVVTNKGLNQSLDILKKIINTIESNFVPKNKVICEPFLTKYNKYPTISKSDNNKIESKNILNFMTWADGHNDLIDISYKLGIKYSLCLDISNFLKNNNLIK